MNRTPRSKVRTAASWQAMDVLNLLIAFLFIAALILLWPGKLDLNERNEQTVVQGMPAPEQTAMVTTEQTVEAVPASKPEANLKAKPEVAPDASIEEASTVAQRAENDPASTSVQRIETAEQKPDSPIAADSETPVAPVAPIAQTEEPIAPAQVAQDANPIEANTSLEQPLDNTDELPESKTAQVEPPAPEATASLDEPEPAPIAQTEEPIAPVQVPQDPNPIEANTSLEQPVGNTDELHESKTAQVEPPAPEVPASLDEPEPAPVAKTEETIEPAQVAQAAVPIDETGPQIPASSTEEPSSPAGATESDENKPIEQTALSQYEQDELPNQAPVKSEVASDEVTAEGAPGVESPLVEALATITTAEQNEVSIPEPATPVHANAEQPAPLILADSRPATEQKPRVAESFDCSQLNRGVNLSVGSGRADLSQSARSQLQSIARCIRLLDGRYEIGGHTDYLGDPLENLLLSVERAQAAANALLAMGVQARQLAVKGFGQTQPIADNFTAKGRARNRRITVIRRNG